MTDLEKRELSKHPLKSAEILDISMPVINKLSDKALRVLASTLVSSSNKRIRRLLNAAPKGISEAALRSSGVLYSRIGETDMDEVDVKFFSIANKDRNAVLRETRRMIEFQRMKTSTVKGSIEARKRNEINVFGQTREQRKRKETLSKKAECLIGESSKLHDDTGINEDVMIDYNFLRDNPDLNEDEILSAIFKFYRRYEENNQAIIKDYGSDKILRSVGAYVSGIKKPISTRNELYTLLNDDMPRIIQQEWELLPNQEEEEEEFFAAFERHQKTGEPVFSEKDGWL